MNSRAVRVWAAAGVLALAAGASAEPEEKACVLQDVMALADFSGGGQLGVALKDLEASELASLKVEGGARIARVTPDSPAAKAGLQEGDVIVRFQGEPAVSARKLSRLVKELPPGRSVKLDIRRGAEARTVDVTLGESRPLARLREMPQIKALANRDFPRDFELFLGRGPRRLGIEYQEISGQLASYFRLDRDRGVLVTQVDEGSAAARAGLKAGDVVLAFGGEVIDSGAELRRQIERAEDGEVALKVLRDGKTLDLKVTLARPVERNNSAV